MRCGVRFIVVCAMVVGVGLAVGDCVLAIGCRVCFAKSLSSLGLCQWAASVAFRV